MASEAESKEGNPMPSTNSPTIEPKKTDASPPAGDTNHSPKRKNSEVAAHTENGDGKKKRRKVNHACVYCRRSHMTCDLERPCARCVKRDIGHLCRDEPREPPRRSKSDVGIADLAPAPDETSILDAKSELIASNSNGQYADSNGDLAMAHANGNSDPPNIAQPRPISPSRLQRQSSASNTNHNLMQMDWNSGSMPGQFHDIHHLHPTFNMFNTQEVSQEYDLLNDFLTENLMTGNDMLFNTDASQIFADPNMTVPALSANPDVPQAPSSNLTQHVQADQDISRPSSTFPQNPSDTRAREKFWLTAADPAGSSSPEERLHKLLKAKYDAGLLKPFNYVKGYAHLNQYMSTHISRESQMRVLAQLSSFRPGFRKAMQGLNDIQLLMVEMWFERSLMEYDRVFASMAIPACCWRRTGEVFRGNTEMAELIHQPLDKLRDGRIAIHEIIAEESLVSYWEKFGAIAFDPKQKAILTSCTLRRPVQPAAPTTHGPYNGTEKNGDGMKGPMETVKCCFSFTIRRDSHNIPSLIVGNFLPIRDRSERS